MPVIVLKCCRGRSLKIFNITIHPLPLTEESSRINNRCKILSNKQYKTKEMAFLSHPSPSPLAMLKRSAANKVPP